MIASLQAWASGLPPPLEPNPRLFDPPVVETPGLPAETLLVTWRKVGSFIICYRAQANLPDYAQWFERLARQLDKRLTELGEVHPPSMTPMTTKPAG